MYYLLENTKFAIEALHANKLRSFLTLLGVIIGVAAVIMVGSASRSGRDIIFKELETFGLKSVWVYRSYHDEKPGKTVKPGTGINNDDIEAIIKECGTIKRISPVIERRGIWAKRGNKYVRIRFLAVESSYDNINNDNIIKGRFILPDDVKYRRLVCVIGSKIVDELFENEQAIGKEISLDGYKYTVVGILQEKHRDFLTSIGSVGGVDANARAIIPISVFQRQYNTKESNYIQAESINLSKAKEAAEKIKDILSRRHKGVYLYASQTMQQYIETANKILLIVTWIGTLAAIISLLAGGIGIMNIMFASVVERTKEIGIRKAIGARKIDIILQFLIESILISLFGGIIGTITGISLSCAIELLSQKPLLIAYGYIILSLLVSVIIGILSGIYPAMRAASMDPVDALRFE